VLSIVHVLSSFGVGGQERVALDLAIGQKARGHRVGVLSLAPAPDGAMVDEFAAAGIATARVPKRGGFDPLLVTRLAAALRKLGADVVHTHNPLPLIYGAPAARLAGAVAIHTKHGINPGGRRQRWLRRSAARLVHAFVAVSDTTAEQARAQHDAAPGKLHTIPNGIRLDRYAPDRAARAAARAELGLADAWVVGTVGRLDAAKNQAMLIRAMAPLLSECVRLVIIGDGDQRAALEAEIAALPEPRWVVMTGRRMDVPHLVHAFDVFALSSRTEGLPLVVPEAMAAGLPIVTTDVGGLPGVVADQRTGLVVPVDEAALAAALAALAADRPRARAMGEAARRDALARFGFDRMVDAYLALYAAGLGERAGQLEERGAGGGAAAREIGLEHQLLDQPEIAGGGDQAIAGAAD
jgi:glycosyltransferase involved in cell wall biosynthesis